MGDQLQKLLIEVPRSLAVVERLLEEVKGEQKDQSRELRAIGERIAKLEADKEWNGEDRRDVHNRLGSGDQTFIKIDHQIATAQQAADRAAGVAKTALDAIDAHTSGRHGEPTKRRSRWWKWAEILAPYVINAIITGSAWLYYHLRFLAELAAKEGRP
jgi:hypothetical protein